MASPMPSRENTRALASEGSSNLERNGFKLVEDFVSCDDRRSQALEFGQRSVPNFRGQGCDRVTDDRHAPPSLQHALNRATDAVFCHHSKLTKFRSVA